jgi:predicted  nucleic acid-binding Zn-ribbon protein
MSDGAEHNRSSDLLATLLSPLRLPGRVVGEIENASRALLSLQESAEVHLASLDHRAGALIEGLAGLREAVDRIEGKVDGLMGLETTIEERMEGVRHDLNERLLAVEGEVRGIRVPIEQMTRDVQTIGRLLPDPSDGPIARLRDTFTSS